MEIVLPYGFYTSAEKLRLPERAGVLSASGEKQLYAGSGVCLCGGDYFLKPLHERSDPPVSVQGAALSQEKGIISDGAGMAWEKAKK